MLAAGLAQGTTRITALPDSEDVTACRRLLEAADIEVRELSPTELEIQGRSPAAGDLWSPAGPLDCGESGTLARLITAILAFCADTARQQRITVSGTLLTRFSPPLFETLAQSGVEISSESPDGSWPATLLATAPGETHLLQSPVSSQELSGLLMALAAHATTPRGRAVLVMGGLPSEPYVAMTAGVLETFGARVSHHGSEWRVSGPLLAPEYPLEIETDASAAAVALAAACLSGGEVRVPGFQEKSWQGDLAIVDHLRAFGCSVERKSTELIASGAPTRTVDLDLVDAPDLAPVLAAVAGAVALRGIAGTSRLRGLETLNGKESRRVEVLAGGLRALGLEVRDTDEQLEISPAATEPTAGELTLDPHGDHRMAFAFALLGLVRPGLHVSNPACVAKSWPSFWEALGAR